MVRATPTEKREGLVPDTRKVVKMIVISHHDSYVCAYEQGKKCLFYERFGLILIFLRNHWSVVII